MKNNYEEMDYEEFMDIDDQSLDVEWLEQPKKMVQMVQQAAFAKKQMDQAKDNVSFVRAELAKKIRVAPEKYGLDKVTETAISGVVDLEKEFRSAQNEFLEARFEYEVAKGSCDATEQRKSALENLVKLHGQQYFAGPRVPRNIGEERQKYREKKAKKKEVNSSIGAKLKRTK